LSGFISTGTCQTNSLLETANQEKLDTEYVARELHGFTTDEIDENTEIAQTFTVRTNGSLVRVELQLYWSGQQPTDSLHFDIRKVNGSTPTETNNGSNILAIANLELKDIPPHGRHDRKISWMSFKFPPVKVSAGEELAIILMSETSTYEK